jgi:phasin family protein
MLTPEQLRAAQKANMETLLGLTHKAFEGLQNLVELNMQLARSAVSDSANIAKAVLSVHDAQELLALQAEWLQPAAEKAAAYNHSLYKLAQAAQAQWVKAAEAQMSAAQQNLHAMIDTAAQSAPAGSEHAVALVKSAVTAANQALEQVHKAARQAADITDVNLQAMAARVATLRKAGGQAATKATQTTRSGSKSTRRGA